MRTIAVSVAVAMLVLTVGTAQAQIAKPVIEEGWTVLVCSIFSSASSVTIRAAQDGKELASIGEWTPQNKATKWVLPAAMAEVDNLTVQLKATPPDKNVKACVMYRRVTRRLFDFSGEATVTAPKNGELVNCPCARGVSLDEHL